MTDLTKFTGEIKNISGRKIYIGDYRCYANQITVIDKPTNITEFVENGLIEVFVYDF